MAFIFQKVVNLQNKKTTDVAAAYIADNLFTKNGNSSFFKLKICGFTDRNILDISCKLVKYFLDFPLWE